MVHYFWHRAHRVSSRGSHLRQSESRRMFFSWAHEDGHHGDSFGSRLVDCTSTFHICNDRGPRETREMRETETEREKERQMEKEEEKMRDGEMRKRRGGRRVLSERNREEEERCALASGSGAREYGPHLDAWDRHPRYPGINVPTIIAYTRHLRTYSRLLRRERQPGGVIRGALATRADQPFAFEGRSLWSLAWDRSWTLLFFLWSRRWIHMI